MTSLGTIILLCVVFGFAAAQERTKRQAYDGNYPGAAAYRQPQQGYQQQQQPQGYQQQPQAYGRQPAQQYAPQQPAQHYAPQQPAHKPPRQHGSAAVEEEKEEGPHPLQLILENSKFECGAKSDGYYADSGVGCQAFHYCVSGQKHSMMCPAGTVFHQVHLNCVPQDQDICNKADKFFFVNDYLNRPLEQKGPNNTVQYAPRYYPDNYAVGDPFIPPQEAKKEPPAATYGLGPAYREQQPGPVHQPQAYHPQQSAHGQQAPAHLQNVAPYAAHAQQSPVHRPQNAAPYTPPAQAYQRPAHQYQPQPARPAQHQSQSYGYGANAQQEYNAQAQAAQRAYSQNQYQAAAPQQHLYGASAGQRPRYA